MRLLVSLAACAIVQVAGAFDLQSDLDQRVALNNGYGGGVFRVSSNRVLLGWLLWTAHAPRTADGEPRLQYVEDLHRGHGAAAGGSW